MAPMIRRLQCFLFLTLTLIISLFPAAALAASTTSNMSLPGCPNTCGNITIPYPFGTRAGCYRPGFDITCNESATPAKAIMGTNIEVLDFNITSAEIRVLNFIGYVCYNQNSQQNDTWSTPSSNIGETKTYLFSHRRNKFTVIGCYSLAYINGAQGNGSYSSGCASFCQSLNSTTGNGGSCNGLGCCQTAIPAGLSYYEVSWGFNGNQAWSFNPCSYAALMQEDWYNFTVDDLVGNRFYERNQNNVPIVLDWAIRENGTCLASHVESSASPACQSIHSGCDNTTNGDGYICKCLQGYEGNPYVPNGCTDINECNIPNQYPCTGTCVNIEGNYECLCPKGTRGDGKAGNCTKIPENFPYPAKVAIGSILGVAVLVGICFLAIWHKQRRRYIKEKDEYKKYYEMMDNHLRVFATKQIKIATNNFDENHIIGVGGHGKVYKGLLENNMAVAIKKSKEIDEVQRGEFVNEIILLSHINHKNIVRLIGCCLEVQIPMLVYEYVPNGTLFDLLHGKSKNRNRPISLGTRLRIAVESAEALDYLHSSIAHSILHGDVKSANILLDDEYHAKVSDFGASNLLPVDDAQIVELVQGTRGYLDPECLCTQIITKKSDVYSFGVVILELITRKKAIYVDNETGEKQHLASCFISRVSKNKIHDMWDVEIVTNDEKVNLVLQEISELAVQCLSVRGEDRPTMKQVVEELQKLLRFHTSLSSWQIDPEETDSLLSETKFDSVSDTPAFHSTNYMKVLEIDTEAPR
ncbi:Wall-associated kinase family protein [Rhynchospora pubera]|uniref:Wall-associated kinase family protein n=1 Tax=Rhynchospora pubera TaxID=906938 RepID=A0AAV8H325_9POAL|nr:Wall-associated kinase family protein [Rhynchospora pubera]